jgi:hypothetical protein
VFPWARFKQDPEKVFDLLFPKLAGGVLKFSSAPLGFQVIGRRENEHQVGALEFCGQAVTPIGTFPNALVAPDVRLSEKRRAQLLPEFPHRLFVFVGIAYEDAWVMV